MMRKQVTEESIALILDPINPGPVYEIKEKAVSCNRALDQDLYHILIHPVQ